MAVAVYLTYETSGTPFTIARITDLDAIKDVARIAVASAEARVAACAEIDPMLAETERLELQRLKATLRLLAGNFEASVPAERADVSPVGVM